MTLRTYIDRAIHDGTDFDAVISGCDVQQTFCWQPDMCITDACEAEYRALLDAEVARACRRTGRALFHHRDLHGQALSRRRLFPVHGGLLQPARVPGGCFAPDDPIKRPHGPGAKTLRGRAFAAG